ncbi:ferredoxin [Mycobacterium sp. URHB0021]
MDEDRCRGHGMCLTLCLDVFTMTDDDYAIAHPSEVPAGLEGAAKDAIDNWPEQPIVDIH